MESAPVHIAQAALDHLVNVANGDARALLNALELAVETTEPDDSGTIPITLEVAEESIQRRAVLYDKEGGCPLRHHQRLYQKCARL